MFCAYQKNDVDWILGAYADEVDGMEEDDGIQGTIRDTTP